MLTRARTHTQMFPQKIKGRGGGEQPILSQVPPPGPSFGPLHWAELVTPLPMKATGKPRPFLLGPFPHRTAGGSTDTDFQSKTKAETKMCLCPSWTYTHASSAFAPSPSPCPCPLPFLVNEKQKPMDPETNLRERKHRRGDG